MIFLMFLLLSIVSGMSGTVSIGYSAYSNQIMYLLLGLFLYFLTWVFYNIADEIGF